MRYEVAISFHGRSAKTKAVTYGRTKLASTDAVVVLDARDDDAAWEQVLKLVAPGDKRPIQGRSYLRHARVKDIYEDGTLYPASFQVGDSVRLHVPYGGFASVDGPYVDGNVSEVLSDTRYSIALHGYHNRFVDFSTREFAGRSGKFLRIA
jgi:hypothetical protein